MQLGRTSDAPRWLLSLWATVWPEVARQSHVQCRSELQRRYQAADRNALAQMLVCPCVNELRADSDAICGTLHTSFNHMRNAEFIRYLTQVSLRAALVLHH